MSISRSIILPRDFSAGLSRHRGIDVCASLADCRSFAPDLWPFGRPGVFDSMATGIEGAAAGPLMPDRHFRASHLLVFFSVANSAVTERPTETAIWTSLLNTLYRIGCRLKQVDRGIMMIPAPNFFNLRAAIHALRFMRLAIWRKLRPNCR